MVRGIAVMRRRADAYVNATQILKVAGVDKGRRTKILEKEILPGKHEIVQGGYGKYQGTWSVSIHLTSLHCSSYLRDIHRIPLERGRDIALQYGVAPLLAPLFEFTPSTNSLGALPGINSGGTISPRPLSASSSYGSASVPTPYIPAMPSTLAPPPILPGSALRLLNQGRAEGLFTPSTSGLVPSRPASYASPGPRHGGLSQPTSDLPSPPPSGQQSLKRNRSEADADTALNAASSHFTSIYPPHHSSQMVLDPAADIQVFEGSRPSSTGPKGNGEDGPSPSKRFRKNSPSQHIVWQLSSRSQSQTPLAGHASIKLDSRVQTSTPQPPNGISSKLSPRCLAENRTS